jgi:hypothetical protein
MPEFHDKIKSLISNYGENIDITMILHIIIYLATVYLFPTSMLLANIFRMGGIIVAVRRIKTWWESKKEDILGKEKLNILSENDLIIRKLKLFINASVPQYNHLFSFNNDGKIGYIEQSIWYFTLQVFSWILQTIFWSYGSILINALLLIFTMPIFTILVTNCHYFLQVCIKLISVIRHLIAFVMSKITSNTINILSEICLNTNPKIDYIELMTYYEDFSESLINTFSFFKSACILTVFHYFKKTDNVFYYYMVDIIQKYHVDTLFNIQVLQFKESLEEKQKYLATIIKTRKWEEFLKPKPISMMFDMYESKNNDMFSRKIGILIRNASINIGRFFAIWSIGEMSPIIAILVDGYFTFFDNKFFIKHHNVSYLIGVIMIFLELPMIGILMMILSDILIKHILEYIDDQQIINKYVIRNTDQFKYLLIVLSAYKLRYVSLIFPFFAHYINNNMFLTGNLFGVIILCILSNFSLIHIFLTWGLSNIVYNVMTYKDEIIEQKTNLNLELVENYLHNPLFQDKNNNIMATPVKIQEEPRIKKPLFVENQKYNYRSTQRTNICKLLTDIFHFKYN